MKEFKVEKWYVAHNTNGERFKVKCDDIDLDVVARSMVFNFVTEDGIYISLEKKNIKTFSFMGMEKGKVIPESIEYFELLGSVVQAEEVVE